LSTKWFKASYSYDENHTGFGSNLWVILIISGIRVVKHTTHKIIHLSANINQSLQHTF